MISLELLSKYRTQLMGVAIMGILMFHSRLPIEFHTLYAFVFNNGFVGVEMFFLLSGFGIFFSINKSTSIKEFYKKRVLRILPYYLPIVLLFSIIAMLAGFWSVADTINNLLMIGFWLNHGFWHIFDWYVPAIILLYIITPFFFSIYKKNKVTIMLVFCLLPISLVVCNNWIVNLNLDYLYLFLCRAPLYFVGFGLADFLRKHKNYIFPTYTVILFILILLVGISLLAYWYISSQNWSEYTVYGREMLTCLVLVFPGCMLLTYILSRLKNYKYPILTFFGTYTLSLYIFHERILIIAKFTILDQVTDASYIITVKLICLAITIVLAVMWQKLIDRLVSKFEKKKLVFTK